MGKEGYIDDWKDLPGAEEYDRWLRKWEHKRTEEEIARNKGSPGTRKCTLCGSDDTHNMIGSRYWCYTCGRTFYCYD